MRTMPMHPQAHRSTRNLPEAIPWEWLEPHREQAVKNHSQTLERLAERGGICAVEALAIIRGCSQFDLRDTSQAEAWAEVLRMKTEPSKIDHGELWSLFRDILAQGCAIQQDYAAGKYPSYETFSARMDAAARERVNEFMKRKSS